MHETEERDSVEHFLICERSAPLKRRALDRAENIDWNRMRLHATQGERESDALAGSLAHADDSARADLETDLASRVDRPYLVFNGMSGAETGEEVGSSLKIAVVAAHAGIP